MLAGECSGSSLPRNNISEISPGNVYVRLLSLSKYMPDLHSGFIQLNDINLQIFLLLVHGLEDNDLGFEQLAPSSASDTGIFNSTAAALQSLLNPDNLVRFAAQNRHRRRHNGSLIIYVARARLYAASFNLINYIGFIYPVSHDLRREVLACFQNLPACESPSRK